MHHSDSSLLVVKHTEHHHELQLGGVSTCNRFWTLGDSDAGISGSEGELTLYHVQMCWRALGRGALEQFCTYVVAFGGAEQSVIFVLLFQ